MNEIIQIKCPFDGAVLSVKNQPGIENKFVTCPICKHKYPFSQFRRVEPAPPIPDDGDEHTQYSTEHKPEPELIIGKLTLQATGQTFQLTPGRNVVGRRSPGSTAAIQIDTGAGRRLSRQQIVIEVKRVPGKGFCHYVSLAKEKVNPTFIGKEPLLYGDCIVLSHGDSILLPDATLKFTLPDEEATDI